MQKKTKNSVRKEDSFSITILNKKITNKWILLLILLLFIFTNFITIYDGASHVFISFKHYVADFTGMGSDFSISIDNYKSLIIKQNESLEFAVYVTNKYHKLNPASLSIYGKNLSQEDIKLICLDFLNKQNVYCQNDTFSYNHQYYESDEPVFYQFEVYLTNYSPGNYSICFEVVHYDYKKNKKEECLDFSVIN